MIHTKTSEYFSLNKTGTCLWEHMYNGTCSKEQLYQVLSTSFEIKNDDIQRDLDGFISRLSDANLLLEFEIVDKESPNSPEKNNSNLLDSYEAPELIKFGDLETLMLSGE